MHPLSPVLATAVFNEIEASAREHAAQPRRPSRLRKARNRIAARRGPASSPSYGPRSTVRAGRA
ncbi:MAG: hypothetical protein QOK21_707 [Solirubrobacteraceae bacterium]|jgi:hypothetical protein|nr:hypothetical protein [Solirubrobacteraceae bacterium]